LAHHCVGRVRSVRPSPGDARRHHVRGRIEPQGIETRTGLPGNGGERLTLFRRRIHRIDYDPVAGGQYGSGTVPPGGVDPFRDFGPISGLGQSHERRHGHELLA